MPFFTMSLYVPDLNTSITVYGSSHFGPNDPELIYLCVTHTFFKTESPSLKIFLWTLEMKCIFIFLWYMATFIGNHFIFLPRNPSLHSWLLLWYGTIIIFVVIHQPTIPLWCWAFFLGWFWRFCLGPPLVHLLGDYIEWKNVYEFPNLHTLHSISSFRTV